eukprot:NODE_1309_length_1378_cov_1.683346.p1 type:complete len:230 gc:universal NODE_1309_length_1378_cov_1.683346:1145-456(-)
MFDLDDEMMLLLCVIHRRNRRREQSVLINRYYYQYLLGNYTNYQFFSIFRTTRPIFYSLLAMIQQMEPSWTHSERNLLITLYRLGHANGYRAVGAFFQISHNCARLGFIQIINFFCKYSSLFIKYPKEDEMTVIAEDFARKCPRNDIVGAMDGTYIRINKPQNPHFNSWYCRKQFFAIHMLALCDWRMVFTYVDIGNPGNTHDSTAFLQSSLYTDILQNQFKLRQGILF